MNGKHSTIGVRDRLVRERCYLGDGAYVGIDADTGAVVLSAEDGTRAYEMVILDANGVLSFLHWLSATEYAALIPKVAPRANQ